MDKLKISGLCFLLLFTESSFADNPCGYACTKKLIRQMTSGKGPAGPQGPQGLPGANGANGVQTTCTANAGGCMIFVTMTTVLGDMSLQTDPLNITPVLPGGDGLTEADAICQAEGEVRYGVGRNWAAWLSATGVGNNARDRISYNARKFYYNASQYIVFEPTDILTSTFRGVSGILDTVFAQWTGTDATGNVIGGFTCNDWMSQAGADNGQIGNSSVTTNQWTSAAFMPCNQINVHLYCVETGS